MGLKVSELKISPIIAIYKNRGDYISSENVKNDEVEEYINCPSVTDKHNFCWGMLEFPRKEEAFFTWYL